MLNKNTWGVKRCEANQKQHCKQAGVTKGLISAEAKKLIFFNSLNNTQYYSIFSQVRMIGFVTWPPFFIPINYYKRWPSDKANHTCENML